MLKSKQAKQTLEYLLSHATGDTSKQYPEPLVSGYYSDQFGFTAFDNTDHQCWVEDFVTELEAVNWINGINN